MNKKVNNIVLSLNQIKVSPGNISKNAQTILKAIFKAKSKKIDLLVFPEFSTTGYLIGDIWERNSFLEDNEYWVDKIIKSTGDTTVIFGTVVVDRKKKGEDGRPRKFNSLIVAQNGVALKNKAIGEFQFPKTLLPNYREFDEYNNLDKRIKKKKGESKEVYKQEITYY